MRSRKHGKYCEKREKKRKEGKKRREKERV
jgi:hypothetical protein